MAWPVWWDWELELTPHLEKRMEDRAFTEVDLRAMLERADASRPGRVEGRWITATRHRRARWEVIPYTTPFTLEVATSPRALGSHCRARPR